MCLKCKALKKTWWLIYKLITYPVFRPEIYDEHIARYEASSAWRALKMQTKKHTFGVIK